MEQLHLTDTGLRVLKTTNTSRKTGRVPVTVRSNPTLLAQIALVRQRELVTHGKLR